MSKYISLNRQFSLVSKDKQDTDEYDVSLRHVFGKPDSWEELLREYRCVVLAEAGAGKTVEFTERAKLVKKEGKFSFFIRIEYIVNQFSEAFEVGDEDAFNGWLASSEEAWFFLDSVDEAQLSSPRAFDKAIRLFAQGIKKGAHRAHIYVSSRPYSWRVKADQLLMDNHLFIPSSATSQSDSQPSSTLKVYGLNPLDKNRISAYCKARETKGIDRLINEVQRLSLWGLAERPFDLDLIITKWEKDSSLDGRLSLLQQNIDIRLAENHSDVRTALNADKARDGAQRLAAAVVLTGNVGINIPDSLHDKKGIDADTILFDWDREDVKTLLESALFNDIIYGAVRFRHRDIRELLAAEFFVKLLKSGRDRLQIESYFFKKSFGETIVTPLLRPLLPWLILFDDNIRIKALDIKPEIAVEEGDPSQLPLPVRKKILSDIVIRIANDSHKYSIRNNDSIARIAQSDLSEYVSNLISTNCNNDDVIFFLARLVWQGNMANCIKLLMPIISNSNRGKYLIIVSIRAAMTCGTEEQKKLLWEDINDNHDVILREILVELINGMTPTENSIELLLYSIPKLARYEEFESSRLSYFLSQFIECASSKIIVTFLDGIFPYLKTAPYLDKSECRVSEHYAWLLCVALKCIEKLTLDRDNYVLSKTSLSILESAAKMNFWRQDSSEELKHDLKKLVPQWSELNEALYWYSIDKARSNSDAKGNTFTDDNRISYIDHFWCLDGSCFFYLLSCIKRRSLNDDRLVALNAAYRVYLQLEPKDNMLEELKSAVKGSGVLVERLDKLLNPVASEYDLKLKDDRVKRASKVKDERVKIEFNRREWIASLRNNPQRIKNPLVAIGEISNDHLCLMRELEKQSSDYNCFDYSKWQMLIPEFGEEVATAYKNFCMLHWRNYKPQLRSEEELENSIPYSLILALAGLEIEAIEVDDFPKSLNNAEINRALRYITWDMNCFPSWFENMHKEFPKETEVSVLKEVVWELEEHKQEGGINHILHDLVYYAPWLNVHIASKILEHLMHATTSVSLKKELCVRVLIEGGTEPEKLSQLAEQNIATNQSNSDEAAWWFALLVDSVPNIGIPKLEHWLASLDQGEATSAMEIFIVALLGSRMSRKSIYSAGRFKTVQHIKSLYLLTHKYIKLSEDLERAGKGAYSPTTRDDAQNSRDMLFNYLIEVPSKASYYAIKSLIDINPDESCRPWMLERAYRIAETQGDMAPWSAHKFKEFHKSNIIIPESQGQLFELAVQQLNIIKDWVENGNDSPWMTWQRAKTENEVRTLIAGMLRLNSKGHYTIAEEPELANEQRMDIWIANPCIASPVPIELKLLDKSWSGPKLCERLRNQLVGDYLRERSASNGVFLLVSLSTNKKWKIGGKLVGIEGLSSAMKDYWQTISHENIGIEEIEVVVIDMGKRALVCDS
ncbi:NACHT domain-containing protein [Psychromonas sp. Urea-02u-13]|nr:hypothetical protein [Psychromonas sp. Urea-02u-13]